MNLEQLALTTKALADRTRRQLDSAQHKLYPGVTDEKIKYLFKMFGDDIAPDILSNLTSQKDTVSIGYKASKISPKLYAAMVDELGETTAKKIAKMLQDAGTSDVTRSGDSGYHTDPRHMAKDIDPFWSVFITPRKKELPPEVRYQHDAFWQPFLNNKD
jgi:hypothetical protein